MSDLDALDTLLLPFKDGLLQWPAAGTVFLRARADARLRDVPNLLCEQSYKPDVDALHRLKLAVADTVVTQQYELILILPPRQRDEARALFARAVLLVKPGGHIVACVANDEGARSSENDLKQLVGSVNTLSKNKCRVFWTMPASPDWQKSPLTAEWLQLDAIRPIADHRFLSRPGIFAWDRIDPASELLARHLPNDLLGHAADLGAGFGYLAVELLNRCPRIRALDVYEAELRALNLAKENLAPFASRCELNYRWHDVTTGLPQRYDVIVTNPPFHSQTRHERPDIGRRFIAVAAEALKPSGRLWLVANRHLPYESVLTESFGTVRIVAQEQGFKIIEAIKAAAKSARGAR